MRRRRRSGWLIPGEARTPESDSAPAKPTKRRPRKGKEQGKASRAKQTPDPPRRRRRVSAARSPRNDTRDEDFPEVPGINAPLDDDFFIQEPDDDALYGDERECDRRREWADANGYYEEADWLDDERADDPQEDDTREKPQVLVSPPAPPFRPPPEAAPILHELVAALDAFAGTPARIEIGKETFLEYFKACEDACPHHYHEWNGIWVRRVDTPVYLALVPADGAPVVVRGKGA